MGTKARALNGGDIQFQTDDRTGDLRMVANMALIPNGTQIAGQITGTAANTYVRGPNVYSPDGFMIGGHPSNTSYVMYGMSGTPGFTLGAGHTQYLPVGNLNEIFLSVATSGDKIVWSVI